MSGNGPLHPLRQRPTPPRPPHQPLPPLPALPPQHQQVVKMQQQQQQRQPSSQSLQGTSQNGFASTETPIRRSATGSTTASNGSGSAKFNSPPPPPAPPPRDVPLPPLPTNIPGGIAQSSSSRSAQLMGASSSSSLRQEERVGKDYGSLGVKGRGETVKDDSYQMRQASLPSRLAGSSRSNAVSELSLTSRERLSPQSQQDRSMSGGVLSDERPRKSSTEVGRVVDPASEPRSRKSSMDAVRTMTTNSRPPVPRTKPPEPLAKVSLAPEADDGWQAGPAESYGRARGSLEMDRQVQAESSRQAQLRGLGIAAVGPPPQPRQKPLSPPKVQQSKPAQPNTSTSTRKSGEQDRNVLPGQSPQMNGSWPAATGKKWSISPLVQMMDDSFSKRQDYSSMNGRRSEDPGSLMGRGTSTPEPTKPAVQPRKSSGGLRGLFSRNKKDKDKVVKNPPTSAQAAPVDFAPPIRRRASEDMLRTKRHQDEMSSLPVRKTATPEPGLFVRRVTEPMQQRQPPESTPRDERNASPSSASLGRGSSVKSPATTQTVESTESNSTIREGATLSPVLTLPLPQLPTLDFSLGSTFDSMFTSLDGKVSPAEVPANPLHARRRSRSFSEFSKPVLSPPLAASVSHLPSVESNASLVADLVAYSQLETVKNLDSSEPTVPSLSSDHGRTTSSASSQIMDNSPPRTPGSADTVQVNIAGSSSSCSIDGMHASNSVDSADMAIVGKAWTNTVPDKSQKTVRPRLLQLAETNSSSATIIEQDESGSEAGKSAFSPPQTAKLEPSLDIVKPVTVEDRPAAPQIVSKVRKIPLRRRARPVSSKVDNMSLADNLRRILNM
jgi:hypothetical protein